MGHRLLKIVRCALWPKREANQVRDQGPYKDDERHLHKCPQPTLLDNTVQDASVHHVNEGSVGNAHDEEYNRSHTTGCIEGKSAAMTKRYNEKRTRIEGGFTHPLFHPSHSRHTQPNPYNDQRICKPLPAGSNLEKPIHRHAA